MLYLAWAIATAPPLATADGSGRRPSFAAGLFLGAGNPKSYAAMAALFSGVRLADHPVPDLAAKALILVVIIAALNVAWLLLGAALTLLFGDPRTNPIVNIAMAVLLLASVALAFWQ